MLGGSVSHGALNGLSQLASRSPREIPQSRVAAATALLGISHRGEPKPASRRQACKLGRRAKEAAVAPRAANLARSHAHGREAVRVDGGKEGSPRASHRARAPRPARRGWTRALAPGRLAPPPREPTHDATQAAFPPPRPDRPPGARVRELLRLLDLRLQPDGGRLRARHLDPGAAQRRLLRRQGAPEAGLRPLS